MSGQRPPWRGAKTTPVEALNKAIGQAFVEAANVLVVELFGSPAQKAAVRAWQERRRVRDALLLPAPPTPLQAGLEEMRCHGRVEILLAEEHLDRSVARVCADLGIKLPPRPKGASR